MGRGLSDLQKTILRIALENHEAGEQALYADTGADAYYPEILAAHFRWPERKWKFGSLAHCWHSGCPRDPYGWRFSKAEIGSARYTAAHVSLIRAVRRLESRGLVEAVRGSSGRWSGIALTPPGIALASTLSVNPSETRSKD